MWNIRRSTIRCHFGGDGLEVTYLPVDHLGHISLEDLEKAIREDTILVSVMYVNNEVGAVEPIEAISQCIKKKKSEDIVPCRCDPGIWKI